MDSSIPNRSYSPSSLLLQIHHHTHHHTDYYPVHNNHTPSQQPSQSHTHSAQSNKYTQQHQSPLSTDQSQQQRLPLVNLTPNQYNRGTRTIGFYFWIPFQYDIIKRYSIIQRETEKHNIRFCIRKWS
eukprot:TRINITY_DN1198_c0_g1_i2.p1 TRINITY_DN1198_c0_g1~~TRINITY_DN1198_c0_g1_i2.p1  ORF type:complete len:127 (+),score=3.72 TRINITY_DN1198_c0_g1_i2:93-473(+)